MSTTTNENETTTATAPPPEVWAEIDTLMLQKSTGRLGDGAFRLQQLASMFYLSESDLQRRLEAVLRRKADARAAAERDKSIVGEGVVIGEPPAVRHVVLRYSGANDARGTGVIEEHLRELPIPLPEPMAFTRWHPHVDDDGKTFDYLVGVLRRLVAGELKPGRVAYLMRRGERYNPTSGLPVFLSDAPPMNFRPEEWEFIRLPGQSEKKLRAALEDLTGNVERADSANEARPPRGMVSGRW